MSTHAATYQAPHAGASDFASSRTASNLIVLVGRIFFAAIFLMAGAMHFSSQEIGYAASVGVPFAHFAVPATGLLAIVGGLSILLGYHARIGAWPIVLFLVGITPVMHNFWAISNPVVAQDQMAHFLKNLSMLGGALLITQFGAGPWSLDARRS